MVVLETATTDPTAAKPPRPRRWIPVSVRMFVAMLVLTCAGSILRIGIRAYRQGNAIAQIRDLGSSVHFISVGPNWLRELVGDEWMEKFDEVIYIDLHNSNVGDQTLAQMEFLKCTRLDLSGTQITDAGLQHLMGLKHLKTLSLSDTPVSDGGLRHLVELPDLGTLFLDGTQVTDAGLEHLAEQKHLKFLGLSDLPISDIGLRYLAELPDLETLYLDGTPVTDAGLEHLKRLKCLTFLIIERTQVTDAGVAELNRASPQLRIQE